MCVWKERKYANKKEAVVGPFKKRFEQKSFGALIPWEFDRMVQLDDDEVALDGCQVVPGRIVDHLNDPPQEALGLRLRGQVVVRDAHLEAGWSSCSTYNHEAVSSNPTTLKKYWPTTNNLFLFFCSILQLKWQTQLTNSCFRLNKSVEIMRVV